MKIEKQNWRRLPGWRGLCLVLAILWLLGGPAVVSAVTPPVIRSTIYNGAHAEVVHYPLRSWMNTNTANLTVEAWIYAGDLVGHQAIVARGFQTNLYFGLNGNRLRFYRSGGVFADSTGTIFAAASAVGFASSMVSTGRTGMWVPGVKRPCLW